MDETASRAELMALRARVGALEKVVLVLFESVLDRGPLLATLQGELNETDGPLSDGHPIENEGDVDREMLRLAMKQQLEILISTLEE